MTETKQNKKEFLSSYINKEPKWGPIGKEVYERTYSRSKEDGTKENWAETVNRVIDGNTSLVPKKYIERDEIEKLKKMMFDFKFLPAGRHIWVSGVKGRQFLFNCFQANTLVHTIDGIVPIKTLKGKEVKILSQDSKFRIAKFNSYGVQRLFKVTLSTGEEILTTAGHEWITKERVNRVKTINLEGLTVPINTYPKPEKNQDYLDGIKHGIVYGDGSYSYKDQATLCLYGEKQSFISFFDKEQIDIKDGYIRITKGSINSFMKQLPKQEASLSYWYGFIVGLLGTDGQCDSKGCVGINQSNKEDLIKIGNMAKLVGFYPLDIRMTREFSPFDGSRKPCYLLPFKKMSVTADDLIKPSHILKFKSKQTQVRGFEVISVKDTGIDEEVFCCVEPETHTMTIGTGILTGQCHTAGWGENIADHYLFTFNELMKGGGVGANYSNRYIAKYSKVKHKVNLHFVCSPNHLDYSKDFDGRVLKNLLSTKYSYEWPGCIRLEDSREGWIHSLNLLLQKAFYDDGEDLVIDISLIRPYGAPIRGFGGTASGPIVLVEMLQDINKLLEKRLDEKLTSLDHMSIDHFIASCVVAGNVRRSARMAIKSWKDDDIFEFINCKQDTGLHWSTNISVEIDDDFFAAYRKKDSHARKVYRQTVEGMMTNGEPGFWNRSLSSVKEPGDIYCTNPCGEISLQEWENCFDGDTKIITKKFGAEKLKNLVGKKIVVPANGSWHKATVKYFGKQPINEIVFVPVTSAANNKFQNSRSSFQTIVKATPNHRWELIDGQTTTNLKKGDIVPMSASITDLNSKDYQNGVIHGIIFGDGCVDRQYKNGDYRHRIRLFGNKAEEMKQYFKHLTYPPSCNGQPEAWVRHSKNMKQFPSSNESVNYIAGFIYGWMLADGSDKPNGSNCLGSTHPLAETWLKENAALGGWILRAIGESTKITNYGKRKNPLKFFTLSKENKTLAWKVEKITNLSKSSPVYCAIVPGIERFTLANGIKTSNCNLGHINLADFFNNESEMKEAFRLMTRYLIRATFGDITDPKQKEVVSLNRRIGVGFLGFQEWLCKQGKRYSKCHSDQSVRQMMRELQTIVRNEARSYAFQLRIPEPVKVTTLAPTGTISQLAGVTAGAQCIYSRYFKRRVRFSDTDTNLAKLKKQGYPIEKDTYSKNTSVVTFFCKDSLIEQMTELGFDEDIVEQQNEISLDDSLAIQAMLQKEYVDNSISFTINLEPKQCDLIEAKETIIHYLPQLKGTTIMIDNTRKQPPFERISKEEYENAKRQDISQGNVDCANGICPIK